jgi:hypothetical protein
MTGRLRSARLTASVRLAPHNLEQEVADVGLDCGCADVQSPGDGCLVRTFNHRSWNYTFALRQVGAGLRRPAGGTDDDQGEIGRQVPPEFGRPDRVWGVRSVEAIPAVCLSPLEPPAADPKEGAQLGEGEDDPEERVGEADLLVHAGSRPPEGPARSRAAFWRRVLPFSLEGNPARGSANRGSTLVKTVWRACQIR